MAAQTDLMLGQVGVQYNQDGAQPVVRLGKGGEQMASEFNPRFYEQTYRGNVFMLDSGSQTIVAANAAAQAMGTAKFINGLFNPVASGKNLVLISTNVATVSGTPGGPILYGAAGPVTITSAATGTIRCGNIGGVAKSIATPLVQVTLTAQDADTLAMLQIGTQGGPAASAVGAGLYSNFDAIDGKIIIPPGYCFGLVSTATGTTHIVQSTIAWAEIFI